VNTDYRKPWQIIVNLDANHDEAGAWEHRVNPSLRLQPSNRLQAFVSANYTSAHDVAQWIKNEDLDGDGIKENI